MFRNSIELSGKKFSFADYETLAVNSYMCPVCRCSDRGRLIAIYLKKCAASVPCSKFKILHFAPEQPLKKFIDATMEGEQVTADLFMDGVDLVVDITDMNTINSERFDMFICSHVLEHVSDDRQALSELYRILKPGGFGLLLVPIIKGLDCDHQGLDYTEKQRLRCFGQTDHVRIYSRGGLLDKIQSAGFDVNVYEAESAGHHTFKLDGLDPSSRLYILYKPVIIG